MFGELIGLALAQAWIDQSRPDFVLAELGPGRGTLMADILRATRGVAGFAEAATVHLVETSPTLREAQAAAVPSAVFHDSIETLPDLPLFLVANEFFDALPIRQFTRDGRGWRETVVGSQDGALRLGLSPAAPLGLLSHRLEDTKDGDVVEVCPSLPAIQADLTAHVDFAAIAEASPPSIHSAMTPQGVFLERLGITPRAQALAKGLEGDALETHIAAHRRLTAPDQMGTLFKVIGLTPKDAPAIAGLSK